MQGGMDFPDDITTNVFRVGDFKEIHWAFCTARPKDKSTLQYPLSSEDEEEDLAHHLQSSEDILREDGHHVLFDEAKGGVWVFSLSQALDDGIARTLSQNGLESTFVGSVSSGDLATALNSNPPAPPSMKTARSTQPNPKAIEESNTQAYSSNASSNIPSSVSEPNKTGESWKASEGHVSEVYPKFMCALSSSLSHQLGKEREWIQIGPNSCIDARTLGDNHLDMLELHSYATTTKLCFDVKWLSSGTMLILFFQVQLPKHTGMSTVLSRANHATGLPVGSPLVLSPSGVKCQYQGMENLLKSEVQLKSAAKVKASTLSRLAHQGIRSVQEVAWIQVHQERNSNASDNQPVSLWPADLCFCENLMTPLSCDDREPFELSIVDASIDPLQEAESWFLGRSAREEALRARAQEANWGAPVLKDVEDTDDEDILSPFEVQIDQGITPQDVSGIYPTPPDGLPSALLGPSHPNNLQSGDYDGEEKGQQLSDEARGDHQEQEDDDLFGDIDIDMFASNGLTEADISFFDEPGMFHEDLRETGPILALDFTNETTNHPIALDGQGLTEMPHERGDSGSDRNATSNDQEDVVGTKGSDQVFMTTDDSLPDKDCDKKLETAVNTDDIEYGAFEHLNLHHGTSFKGADGDSRGSFEHVPFERSQFNIDDKYNTQGRFAFDVDELPIPKNVDRRSHPENHISNPNVPSEDFPFEESMITGESFLSSLWNKLLLIFDKADDEDEDALTPEDFDTHDAVSFLLGFRAEPSRKRKREQLDENENLATPSSSISLVESPAGSSQKKVDEPTPDLSKPNVLEKTTNVVDFGTRSLGSSGPLFKGRGQAFIKVAQVVASQAVSGFFQSQTDSPDESHLGQGTPDHSLQNTMTKLLSTFFPTNKRCNLKEYASLGEKSAANVLREQVVPNQRSLKPSHIVGGLTSTGQPIFKLESPYTRVRRNGVSTEISASALSFWEELSLGPSYETKDVDAFCLCPKNKFIEEGAMAFLNMIKGAYQSCNLGSHNLGVSPADHTKRLVTIHMDPRKPDKFIQDIGAMCDGLGTKLEELGLQSGTTVIYIINPYKDQRYLPGLCAALSRLPNSYGAALEKRRPERQNNIAMQMVPLDLVWSPERIVVPSPAEYRRLAFEIYNQCGSSESGLSRESNFMKAPAIRLAKAVPKTIDFKLASESSSPLMQSNNCVHLSYVWDNTSEWLAAIWIDNLGVLSWRACYCLGKNNENPWKPFYEAAKEILETSFVMLYPPNAPWQLFVCKDNPMLKSESDVWLRALADSSRPSISFTILTVDAKPRLTFTHSDHHKSSFDLAAPGLLATPGATPQTNTPSPDISGLGSTPAGNAVPVGTPPPNAVPGDHDSEARLIDVTDETWGVVMDGTPGDLSTQSGKFMSLASGYLVKRAGPRDEDGLIPLGVNLVHGQKPYRVVLKEVLGMYRNLSTLARVRGAVDPVKSVLPLHVAAARKVWQVVSETMRYVPE